MFTFDEDAEGFYVPFFMETQVTSAHEDGAIKLTMTTDEPVEWVELSFPYGDNHWAFRIMWEGAS